MLTNKGTLIYKNGVPILSGLPDKDLVGRIHISPFSHKVFKEFHDIGTQSLKKLERFFGTDVVITRSGREALFLLLKDVLKLKRHDTVTILKSLNTLNREYISSCVTKTIESVAGWSREITPTTKAILIIHEFGHPFPKEEIKKLRETHIIIEDWAYGFGANVEGDFFGLEGDYGMVSFSKIFPMQIGGAIVGVKNAAHTLSSHEEDHIRALVAAHLRNLSKAIARRRDNWAYLETGFGKINLKPLVPLEAHTNPGAFILDLTSARHLSLEKLERIKKSLDRCGIENTIYYPKCALVLPCHDGLGESELDYIIGAVNFLVDPTIKCSVPILTLNSERHVGRALKSLSGFDGLFLLDGNSTDRTHEIARDFGVPVYKQVDTDEKNVRIKHFTEVRERAYRFARHDWIFHLDSDEFVSPELKEDIARIVWNNTDSHIAYNVPKKYSIGGKRIEYAFNYPNYIPRLYHKESGIGLKKGKEVHEQLEVPDHIKIVNLTGAVWSDAPETFRDCIKKDEAQLRIMKYKTFEVGLDGKSRLNTLRITLIYFLRAVKILLKSLLIYARYGYKDALPLGHVLRHVRTHLLVSWWKLQLVFM